MTASFDPSRFSVLIVDDEKNIRFSLTERFKDEYAAVHAVASGYEALALLDREPIDIVLLDQKLKESGEHGLDVLAEIKSRHEHVVVIILTAFGEFGQAMQAARLGCYEYLAKPPDFDHLGLIMRNGLVAADLQREVARLRQSQRRQYKVDLIVGTDSPMNGVLGLTQRVARSSSIVLITGETGVGKELIARTVHFHSPRSHGPFVEVNCSSIPETLIESELFGHEKGAFTDARRSKPGLFEVAGGGTLFLDEIGELRLPVQAKLLRVLENKSFRRVGGTEDRTADVRVVCATHRDLREMVDASEFREDLFYRLSVIPIEVPPLRKRVADIPNLVKHFTDLFNSEFHLRVSDIEPGAMECLRRHAWPGNVRELRNVIERVMLTLDGDVITRDDLPDVVRGAASGEPGGISDPLRDTVARAPISVSSPDAVPTLAELERWGIERAMVATGENKTRAAELLGISRQTLRMKLRDFQSQDLAAAEGPAGEAEPTESPDASAPSSTRGV